jgi:protein TonB
MEELSSLYNSMLGLSDTSLGIVASVALHLGVAAALLGPPGSGRGAKPTVITVSLDGEEYVQEIGDTTRQGDLSFSPLATADGEIPIQAVRKKTRPLSAKTVIRSVKSLSESAPKAQPPLAEGGGGLLTSLYSKPLILTMPKPEYPAAARQRGLEGSVELRLAINSDGLIDSVEIVRSSGSEILDVAARGSAARAVFQPATRAGVAEAAHKNVVVNFSLTE